MGKLYKIRNNYKPIGTCDANVDNFRKIIMFQKDSSSVRIYYEVGENETLYGIISSYLSDPEHIKKVVERIKLENQIDEVKKDDIIILWDTPEDYKQDYYIKTIIDEIEERYAFIKDYFINVSEEDLVKYSFIIDFMRQFIETGIYRNMYNLIRCLEKCREVSNEIIELNKKKQVVK